MCAAVSQCLFSGGSIELKCQVVDQPGAADKGGDQNHQLAIIGGGLVGASLALALQAGAKARGWKILLIEPFAPGDSYQPSYDARSSALSFGTQQIYQQLGLWQVIGRRAEPIRQIHVSDRGRFGATRLDALEEGVPALGYVVENAWLGQCLWQGLDSEVVSWRCPAEVTSMQAIERGYRLRLNDDTQLECDLAVLADGGRSGLREQLGIHVRHTPYQQSALIAKGKEPLAPAALETLLKQSARKFPVTIPAATPIGTGILDAKAALDAALKEPCTENCEPEGIPLTNKVTVGGLAGAAASETVYTFEAAAGKTLSVLTYGGSGNVSVYLAQGRVPTATDNDAKSSRPGNTETVRVAKPVAGTYYIKVVGEAAYSGVSILATQ